MTHRHINQSDTQKHTKRMKVIALFVTPTRLVGNDEQ